MRILSNRTKELYKGEQNDSNYTAVYKITFPDDNFPDITAQNIIPETAELEEALWSGSSMCLGGCVSACYRVTVAETEMNIEEGIKEWFWSPDMLNKKIRVYSGYEETEVICIYEGYIKTAKRQEIRSRISIVCNDAFSALFDKDVSSVYNSIFPQSESYKGIWQGGGLYQTGDIFLDETDGNYYMISNHYSKSFLAITKAIWKLMKENTPSALLSPDGVEYEGETTHTVTVHFLYNNKTYTQEINPQDLVKNLGDDIGNIYQTVTFKDFLNAIATYCEYKGTIDMPAGLESKKLYKTMEASNLSGRACIAQIAESLGYCAYINENGNLAFRQLNSNPENAQEISEYEKITYDDHMLTPIDGVCAKDADGNAYYYPEDAEKCQNIYTINENFVFFKPSAEILENPETYNKELLKSIYERIGGFTYQGYQLDTWGMPWLQVGDVIKFTDEGTEIISIIQSRTLKGTTRAFRDCFSAECEESACSINNSCDFSSSSQLQGNTIQLVKEDIKKKLYADDLIAENAKLGYVTSDEIKANIGTYGVLMAEEAKLKYATIEHLIVLEKEVLKKMGVDELEANIAILGYLKSSEAALAYADITLANIDTANINKEAVGQLFAKIGILQNVTIKNGAVTGELNGVRINGDWIDANTLAADKLILRGKDGLFYEINATCSGLSSTELSDEKYKEAIDGTCIIKKSVTAEQINVDTELVRQLFAHDVTATGTITGAVLKGAEAEVVKGKIGGWLIGGSDIYYEGDYAIFSISAGVSAKTPGLIKLRRKDIANSVNTGYITGLEWYGVMESSNFRRSLYINNDGFVFGIQREGETAAHTTKINLGAVKAGDSVTTPAVYTDKLKFKSTNYGVEIGTTASGGSSGVRIGDLSGGNGSYTYITNDCVAQHGLRVSGNLNVEGKLTLAEKLACAVTVKRTTNQSISSSSETTISLDAVNENQDTDVFKLSGGLLIVQKSGYYLLSGTAVMAATGNNATVKRLRIRDQTNNVELASVISRTVGTYQSFVIPPVLVHLSAYTSVSLTYQDDSGSGTVYGNTKNATHLTALKITS